MRVKTMAWWAPKDGNSESEYEDAWATYPPVSTPGLWMRGRNLRIVVADGVSQSSLAGKWARQVVEEFSSSSLASVRYVDDFAATVMAVKARWPEQIAAYVASREAMGRPLTWYQKPGIAKGAFTTLLVLHLCDQSSRFRLGSNMRSQKWYAAAVGDTCFFQVRDGKLLQAFPIADGRGFGTAPASLGSTQADASLVTSKVQFAEGEFARGDDFYACTDALAAWFLNQNVEGLQPWKQLNDMSVSGLNRWLAVVRQKRSIHNDDVTLVHCTVK